MFWVVKSGSKLFSILYFSDSRFVSILGFTVFISERFIEGSASTNIGVIGIERSFNVGADIWRSGRYKPKIFKVGKNLFQPFGNNLLYIGGGFLSIFEFEFS